MAVKRLKFEVYLNLIKVVASIAFLVTAALGTFAFRYNAALCTRKPDLQVAAARAVLPQKHILPAGTIIEQVIK